jgi:hypothetical protein
MRASRHAGEVRGTADEDRPRRRPRPGHVRGDMGVTGGNDGGGGGGGGRREVSRFRPRGGLEPFGMEMGSHFFASMAMRLVSLGGDWFGRWGPSQSTATSRRYRRRRRGEDSRVGGFEATAEDRPPRGRSRGGATSCDAPATMERRFMVGERSLPQTRDRKCHARSRLRNLRTQASDFAAERCEGVR